MLFRSEEYREGKPKSCQGLGEFSYSLQLGKMAMWVGIRNRERTSSGEETAGVKTQMQKGHAYLETA